MLEKRRILSRVDDVRGVSCADFREIKRVDDLAVGQMAKEVKALQKLARVRAAEGDYEGSRSAVSEAASSAEMGWPQLLHT